MTISNKSRKYSIILLGVLIVFAVVNGVLYWLRTPPCCDWTYTSGIPFAFLEEGGFMGIRRLLWGGVIADVGSMFAIAFILNGMAAHPRITRSIITAKHQLQAAVAKESPLPLRQLAIALAIIVSACIAAFLSKH